jgi:hypothetical protein
MAKSSGAGEAVKWIAIGVGALIFVPKILASTTKQNAATQAAYNPAAALAAQQAGLINAGGSGLSNLLKSLLTGGQPQTPSKPGFSASGSTVPSAAKGSTPNSMGGTGDLGQQIADAENRPISDNGEYVPNGFNQSDSNTGDSIGYDSMGNPISSGTASYAPSGMDMSDSDTGDSIGYDSMGYPISSNVGYISNGLDQSDSGYGGGDSSDAASGGGTFDDTGGY